MRTKYDVGQIVYIPAEIVSAHIPSDKNIYYRVRMNLMDTTVTDDIYEKQLADEPKEETNAKT